MRALARALAFGSLVLFLAACGASVGPASPSQPGTSASWKEVREQTFCTGTGCVAQQGITLRSDQAVFVDSEFRHLLAVTEFTPIASLADQAARQAVEVFTPNPNFPESVTTGCSQVKFTTIPLKLEVTRIDGTVLPLITPTTGGQLCFLGDATVAGNLSRKMLDLASREPFVCNPSIPVFGLTIRLVDADGAPVTDATIAATDGTYQEDLTRQGGADSNTWTGARDRPGSYSLRIVAPGFVVQNAGPFNVAPSSCHVVPVDLTLTLKRS